VELGFIEDAGYNLNRSFQLNTRAPFCTWTETPSGGCPDFLTGAGGFLQGVVFGYNRLRIADGRLELRPVLPPGSKRVRVRGAHYLGNTMDLTVRLNGSATVLDVTVTSTDEQPPSARAVAGSVSILSPSKSDLSGHVGSNGVSLARAQAACGHYGHVENIQHDKECVTKAMQSGATHGRAEGLASALSRGLCLVGVDGQLQSLQVGSTASTACPPATGTAPVIKILPC